MFSAFLVFNFPHKKIVYTIIIKISFSKVPLFTPVAFARIENL
jgi:hypothetical protein